jgi:hypothetical protein
MANTLHRTLLRRPWAVWLAVLIAVFSALAPTVSHALALSDRAAPMEASYCSSMGMVEAASDSSGGQDAAAALVHCPFCLHAAERLAVLPSLLLPPLLLPSAHLPPRIQQGVFFSTYFAYAPPPRGPPASL